MAEKTIAERLMGMMNDISNLEVNELELIVAILKNKSELLIEHNMEIITKDFDSKCSYYGKDVKDVQEIKDEILQGYRGEFESISEKFKERYLSLILEVQEAQSNQKVAITNYKKVLDSKRKYLNSTEYKEFLDKIKELEARRDDCEVKEEFDRIVEYLENVKDPVELYNQKIDAFADKYCKYCKLEEEGLKILDNTIDKIEESINTVMQYDVGKLEKAEKKSIFSLLANLFGKVGKAKKFDKEFVATKRENLGKIKENTEALTKEIGEETINSMGLLITYKDKITESFNESVSV